MSPFLALLVLLLPCSTLASPTTSTSAIDCSVSPSLCPNATLDSIHRGSKARLKHAPRATAIITGLTPATASGDVLNTTRCYCASPDWRNDHVFGFYQLFTYYNYHHDATYTFDINCHSSDHKVVNQFGQDRLEPECLRDRRRYRWCQDIDIWGGRGNTFCYEINGGANEDYYYFNKQKRGLPRVSFRESQNKTLEICQGLCQERADHLNVLDGEAFTAVITDPYGIGPAEWCSILSFGDTDDMCERCA